MDLRAAADIALQQEVARRQADPRLRFKSPQLERLANGRWVLEIRRIDDLAKLIAADAMVDLLLRAAVALAAQPGSRDFALSADIKRCLRQINPDHPE
jgi:hypothetical protein